MKVRLLTFALFSFTIEYNVWTNTLISASNAMPYATLYRVSAHLGAERHTAARASFQICPRGFPDRTVGMEHHSMDKNTQGNELLLNCFQARLSFLLLVLWIRDAAKRRHSGSLFRLDSKAKWAMYWFWNLIFNFPFSWSNCHPIERTSGQWWWYPMGTFTQFVTCCSSCVFFCLVCHNQR